MMHEHEDFERWLAGRRDVDPPPDFAERVMGRVLSESAVPTSSRRRVADATWFHIAACVAASLVFALRLGCAYSLFIPS
jgi:hypothetical protein